MANGSINMQDLTDQFNQAVAAVGFKLGEVSRHFFWRLANQCARLENKRVILNAQEQNLRISQDDVLEYTVMTFIQSFGERLWPVNPSTRGHLAGIVSPGSLMDFYGPLNMETHQNCQGIGNHDRSLFQEKLRSPLGSKVKRYFELLHQLPPAMVTNWRSGRQK